MFAWEEDPGEVSRLFKGTVLACGWAVKPPRTIAAVGDVVVSMLYDMFMEGEQPGGRKVRPHQALERLRAAKRAGTLAVETLPTEQAIAGRFSKICRDRRKANAKSHL